MAANVRDKQDAFDVDLEGDGSFAAAGTLHAETVLGSTKPNDRWHHREPAQVVLERLCTHPEDGLDPAEAAARLAKQGCNELTPPLQTPLWRQLLAHFTDLFSLMLQAAALLCLVAYFTEPSETMHLYLAVFLYSVVIATSLFSFIQQYKSDQTLREFRNFLPPQATVKRAGGKVGLVLAKNLVVGDIVHIKLGDKIPADLRILQSNRITVDNSSLTGESEAIELDTGVSETDALNATNLAFFGCSVVDGSGVGVVIATGDRTVFGEIAKLTSRAEGEEGKTTLQHDIHHFVVNISFFAVAVGIFFFIVGLIQGTRLMHNLVYSIGIIVSNIPEGLLATVTVSLTASARRMARRNILVKKLDAVETLGSTTVICSDKTGTLTRNKMNVSHISYGGRVEAVPANWKPPQHAGTSSGAHEAGELDCLQSLIYGATVCSTAVFDAVDLAQHPHRAVEEKVISGDASEAGILRFTEAIHDVEAYRHDNKMVAIVPFNSKNKFMATVHLCPESDHLLRVAFKGAPEIVLSRCTSILSKDGEREMTERDRHLLQKQTTYLAGRGERVLAYAEQRLSPQRAAMITNGDGSRPNIDDIPTTELCFVGMLSLLDPPREGVSGAVQTCKNAGIKVIMVTGDHHETAKSVAQRVGIITREIAGEEEAREKARKSKAIVVKGNELENMSPERWEAILAHQEIVFARTSPHQKLEIVQNLQHLGEVVTVTGDGCNDAPALKQANTGVAMGVSGSDVSREAANIVLLDDHFASIVNGVEEGRLIFDNLKKSIAYTLTSNVPQLIPFIAFIALNIPLPLTTVLILSIDLGTDIFPAIALAYEPAETDIMNRPPRDAKKDHLMNSRLVSYSTLQLGIMQTLAGFFAYLVVFGDYGFAPNTLVGLNSRSRFATERLFDQRWLIGRQEKISGVSYETRWFSEDVPRLAKYFRSKQPGFLKQTDARFSLLPANPSAGKDSTPSPANPAQFQNMIKIIATDSQQPPCLAFSCALDANKGTVVHNSLDCFDVKKNTGPVTLSGAKNGKANDKVVSGRNAWEGCFSLWTPTRSREILRRAQTAFFVAIVVAQIFTLFACKTRILSLFTSGVTNSAILLSLVLELVISFAIVYSPFLRGGFGVRPLRAAHWLPGIPFGILIVFYDECRKWFIRRHLLNESGEIVPERGTTDRIAKWVYDKTLW